MLDILAITTPIFLLIGVGYLAMLGRIVTREHVQGISKFVLYCALPALIIKALTENPLEEVFTPQYLLGYGLGSLAVFTLGVVALRLIGRKPLDACAIHALGMSASNSGFIGYPVAAMVLGSSAGVFLALNMLIENLLIIPAALILAEASQQHGQGVGQAIHQTASRLVRNPILIGLTVGLVLSTTGLPLPGVLAKAIDMLAAAAAPAALFVIGATLFGLRITGMAGEVGQIVVTKLVIHPLAVLGVFLLLPDMDPALLTGALLFACAPMISIFPILGQRYGLQDISAAAMMVATLLSFVTISLAIGLMTYLNLLPA
ncbi:AEC family transporter [Halomonas sp. TRM85114]|uniref:AEC family transporter n=1 Tax=Halomonas jincaotanensis TaxID=2810616 RepID=UPI001BD1BF44|nr:AEC family transporter [Halomonas jincaotanensis]MBS9403831.1 AEC family transporter [Halomonas jincaotanensis]